MRELNLTERQTRGALEYLQSAGIIHFERMWKCGQWIINRDYLDNEE